MKPVLLLVLGCVVATTIWASLPKGADTPLLPKPPSLRLLSVNGPLTLAAGGTSLSAQATWPEAVAKHLQTCIAHPVTLKKLTKGGETSQWGVDNIATLARDAPDIVLLEFTINDADIRRGVSLSQSLQNHRALIDALQQANPEVRIFLLRLNRAYGGRAMIRPRLAAYERQLTRLISETVTIVDTRPLWAKAGREALPDGIHPDPATALEIMKPVLTAALAQSLEGQCSSLED